jgi:uroporphyrinogen-III synthase
MNDRSLHGRTIAIPESRELDVLASLIERRGGTVVRCPLLSILDAPDPGPVLAWVRAFSGGGCDDLILLTGEGLRRIVKAIERHEPSLREPFLRELARVRKITRGPKPARALRELGLHSDIEAVTPTTDGVIATLSGWDLAGRRIGVQLYGTEPNVKLVSFLADRGAQVLTVAPYIYADRVADDAVRQLFERMSRGEIDAITFTSKAQLDRVFALLPPELIQAGFARTRLAAVGPVVESTLQTHGYAAHFMPSEAFFMKPLVRTLEAQLGPKSS